MSNLALNDIFILELEQESHTLDVNLSEKRNLVIIEDDTILRESLKEMGKNYFDKILTFNSVENASLYINNVDLKIDTILIDYFLSGEKGTKIVELIKKINSQCKIYLMSGDLTKIDIEDKQFKDLEEYIQKPLSFKQINKIYN